MLSLDDKAAYYWAASKLFTFGGSIVDLGGLVGASASALALGALNNRACNWETLKLPLVHSYDHWIYDDEGAQCVRYHFPAESLVAGDDMLPKFLELTAPFRPMIETHRGCISIGSHTDEGPIELLSIDICKSRETTDVVFREFMPKLRPGAIVLHQDFIHPWHPYLHTAVGYFADHFEVLYEGREGSTVVYRLVRPIEVSALEQFSVVCLHDRDQWLPLQERAFDQLRTERAKRSLVSAKALLVGEVKSLAAMREVVARAAHDPNNSERDYTWLMEAMAFADRGFV